MAQEVSKEEAKAIIEDSEFGVLVAGSVDSVPVVGEPTPDALGVEMSQKVFRFEDEELEEMFE